MPSIISNNHHLFLQRLMETGKPKFIRKYRKVFGKSKAGYIFPLNLYINYIWNFEEFCMSAL